MNRTQSPDKPLLVRRAGLSGTAIPPRCSTIVVVDFPTLSGLPMQLQRYFVTCGRGIEPVLADELRDLGASHIEQGRGGVHFSGDQALLYQANLWLRTAIRVLWPILEAPVQSPEALYDAVRTVDWTRTHLDTIDACIAKHDESMRLCQV